MDQTSSESAAPWRAVAGILSLAGLAALVAQFALLVRAQAALGHGVVHALVDYLGFFTILTNALAAAVLAMFAVGAGRPAWLASARVRAATAAAIAVVGAVYELLLRKLWHPEGLQAAVDFVLHDAVPVLFVLVWAIGMPRGGLKPRDAFFVLGYPAAYCVYVLARGAVLGRYPYPFVDVGALGFGRVLLNGAGLLGVFLVLGFGAVAFDRRAARQA